MDKCKFFQSEIQYFDHVIDEDGIQPLPEKLRAIVEMPNSTNRKIFHCFFSMVKCYDKFTPDLASKSANFNNLPHKGAKWQWNNQHSEAVQMTKSQ